MKDDMRIRKDIVSYMLRAVFMAFMLTMMSCGGENDETPLNLVKAASEARHQAELKIIEAASATYLVAGTAL